MKESAYSFSEIISLLISLERNIEAEDLLLEYNFLEEKICSIGANELVTDYKNLLNFQISDEQKKEALEELLSALEQTSHILKDHPEQVNSQLIGFLQKGENRYIDIIIETPDRKPKGIRLRPLTPNLSTQQGPLKKVFVGHTENITAINIGNNDQWILSGTEKGIIKVWDVHSNDNLHTLGEEKENKGIIFLTGVDDKYAISLSRGIGEVVLRSWDLSKEKEINSISGEYREGLNKFEISPCKNFLIIKNLKDKKGLSVLNIPNLKLIQQLYPKVEIDNFEVYEHCRKSFFLKKRKLEFRIVTSSFHNSYKNRVAIFVLSENRFKRIKRFFTRNVVASSIHEELIIREKTNTLLIIGLEPIVRLYSLDTGHLLREFIISSQDIRIDKVLLVKNENEMLVFTSDSKVHLWNLEQEEAKEEIGKHASGNPIKNITKNEYAFSYGENSILNIWDLKKASVINTIATRAIVNHICAIQGFGFISNENENINFWEKEIVLEKKNINHESPIKAIEIFDNGTKALTTSGNGGMKLYNLNNYSHKEIIKDDKGKVDVAGIFNKGNRYFALTSNYINGKNFLNVWNLSDVKYRSSLRDYHLSDITRIETFRNGRAAVSISFDYTAKVWDLINEECVFTLYINDHDKENEYGFGITFEIYNHERNLITATSNGTLRIWDLTSGRLIKDLIGHTDSIDSIDITRNGKSAITSSVDGSIKLWSLTSHEYNDIVAEKAIKFFLVQFLPYDFNLGIQSVTESSNNFKETHVVASTNKGVIKIWNINTKQCVQNFVGHSDKVSTLFVLRKSPKLVSITYSGEIILWDIFSSKVIAELYLGREITIVKINEDENLIIIGELNGQVQLIKIEEESGLQITKT